jgi:hypothetical protein
MMAAHAKPAPDRVRLQACTVRSDLGRSSSLVREATQEAEDSPERVPSHVSVAQLAARNLAKVEVAGSRPVTHSRSFPGIFFIKNRYLRWWRNWQTRTPQERVSSDVRVRVSLGAQGLRPLGRRQASLHTSQVAVSAGWGHLLPRPATRSVNPSGTGTGC